MWKKTVLVVLGFVLCGAFACAPLAQAAGTASGAEKPKRIELVLVIDKSGSMSGLESDTVGGFNGMIEKQKKLDVPVNVMAVLFNDKRQLLYAHRNIRDIRPMTEREYTTGGTTALLDAVGDTILRMDRTRGIAAPGTKVIFVIITDGLENASTEFTREKVRQMIAERREKDGWEFVYLGANIDAVKEADAIGVDKKNAVTYSNTHSGVRANYDAVGAYVKEAAEAAGERRGAWKSHVEKAASK